MEGNTAHLTPTYIVLPGHTHMYTHTHRHTLYPHNDKSLMQEAPISLSLGSGFLADGYQH